MRRRVAGTQFNYGARLLLQAMTGAGMSCWRYLFTRRRPGRTAGPHHGDEMGYAFGELAQGRTGEPEPFDDIDRGLSNVIMGAWAAFAKAADPNTLSGEHWPRYDAKPAGAHLELGDRVRIGTDALGARLDFLERYYACEPSGSELHERPK